MKSLPLFLFLLLLLCPEIGAGDDAAPVYSGKYLKQLRVPVGGIGAGNFLVGGRGDIQHIEIFNRPDRARNPVYTFFSLWARPDGGESVAKILERELLPPFTGVTHRSAHGIPRFEEVEYTNSYPLPRWDFHDAEVPVEVGLEVVNPFIPLDLAGSSLPMAAFYWTLRNPRDRGVEVSLALHMENPVRADEIANEAVRRDGFSGLRFSSVAGAEPNYQGALLAGTTAPDPVLQTHWYPGRWRDDLHILWEDFRDDGRLRPVEDRWTSTYRPLAYNDASRRNGSVQVTLRLEPGESRGIPFYFAWYFPERTFTAAETFGIQAAAGKRFRNFYAGRFDGAHAVLRHFLENESALVGATRRFAEAIWGGTLPAYVKEAMMTQAASLKTHLIQVTEEGHAHGFEGVFATNWCCPGTCTHVWNYEQAVASLFPSIERSMREIEFLHNTFDNGFQAHRSVFPLGDYFFNGPAAADGQMGTIIRAYREWKFSGDSAWLARIWPKVRQALLFAWEGPGEVTEPRFQHQENQRAWDPGRTGILTGRQHNTYDISFFGPNSMTSSLYLGALKAGSEMAAAMGEPALAEEFHDVFARGARRFEELLWNGRYFVQIIENDPEAGADDDYELTPVADGGEPIPKYQYGDGCLADQLLGQYLAFNAGLGYLLDPSKVQSALRSIHRYNFIRDLGTFHNAQRVYGLNDEAGVVLCSWPDGDRPLLPFVYADEIWTGVEFQVAASLIYTGQVDAGLEIVKAVQQRHDGYKRNPFEHDESGVHYARAMAGWALLPALSGVAWDGVAGKLRFAPRLTATPFRSFWSTGSAWGTFSRNQHRAVLHVLHGTLPARTITLDQNIAQFSGAPGRVQNQSVHLHPAANLSPGSQLVFHLNSQ